MRSRWHWIGAGLAFGVSAVATACGDPRTSEPGISGGGSSGDLTGLTGSSPSCATPNEGCPCLQEGLSAPCGSVASISTSAVECYHGIRSCRAGVWGACDGVGLTSTRTIPALGTASLGGASACVDNLCDPWCTNYRDAPSGIDAGAGFAVTPDGGLTLTAGSSCAGSPSVDDDGDGWSETQGDCNDCSALVNPGAYDYPGNGFDDDCDGAVDNAPSSCDSGLSLTSSTGDDYAKAMDLCRFTSAGATGAAKTWGVISGTSKLVRADAVGAAVAGQYGIMPLFGNSAHNGAKRGANLAVFSSGKARYSGQSSYTKPKGWCGSYDAKTSSSVPCGLSWNKSGCAAGKAGYDSAGIAFQVRVPTNAQCLSFRFHYLSSEYPEWVCTPYNDTFVAMLKSQSMVPGTGCCGSAPNTRCNISYGASLTPVSVNNDLFGVPGCTSCSSPVLAGTGFDGSCSGYIGGGSTDWLYSHAPVTPGEIATFHTSVWDTGDHVWDSTVLIDSWEWYPGTCAIGTTPSPPTQLPSPPVNSPTQPAEYTRDFEAECPVGTSRQWRMFTYSAMEPLDSKIDFTVRAADTLAAVASATPVPLTTAQGDPTPTTRSADVKPVLPSPPHARWLRLSMLFSPSSNQLSAPTLFDWKQAYDCVPGE